MKTLNGKFDARCHVCWNAIYRLWISEEDPAGKCHFGHRKAPECPDAMARAAESAAAIKMLAADRADKAYLAALQQKDQSRDQG
ncbi:MAG: hypothetical protein ACYDD1_06810 [Caulobacteraceae bacterium]